MTDHENGDGQINPTFSPIVDMDAFFYGKMLVSCATNRAKSMLLLSMINCAYDAFDAAFNISEQSLPDCGAD